MNTAEKTGVGPERLRSRAKRACKVCNARRVRCNVMETHPCHNCRTSGALCELMRSNRGKYGRSVYTERFRIREPTLENSLDTQTQLFLQNQANGPQTGADPTSASQLSHSISEPIVNLSSPSERHTSYNSTKEPTSTDDIDKIVYFGESNLLTSVASESGSSPQDVCSPQPGKNKLCYEISDAINTRASKIFPIVGCTAGTLDHLKQEGALSFPESRECEVILQAYFKWFHPCFPIVDRVEISNLYFKNAVSPLLLQAMLFVGASYSSDETLQHMGFKGRHNAKAQFYQRAKSIYHADWETNKMIITQALFLMSFWRAGPSNEKDTRHWLGCAINIAQAHGFHRSIRLSNPKSKHVNLRKRIWWSIYVRDRQCAASLGLPSRIRDEDCDIEMLDRQDFEKEENSAAPEIFGTPAPEHASYSIQMAKLAILLGRIVTSECTLRGARGVTADNSKLEDDLIQWEMNLPSEMIIGVTTATSTSIDVAGGRIWAYMLHLAYNHLHVLLHRSTYLGVQNVTRERDPAFALQAACRSTRIIEDMLAQNLIQYGQIHLITSIFTALCIHTLELRRSEGVVRTLAEHRAQICLLGLKELRKSWDVNNWVLQLLFQFLDESTLRKLHMSEFEETSNAPKANGTWTPQITSREDTNPTTIREEAVVPGPSQAEGFDTDFISDFLDMKDGEDFFLDQTQPGVLDLDGFSANQYFGSATPGTENLNAQKLDFLSRYL